MKIKALPDDTDMLESNELFQMNGWLAELRDEGRAESLDAGRTEAEEDSYTKSRGDGRAESGHDGRTGSRENGRAGRGNHSQAVSRGHGHAESWEDGRTGSREDGRAGRENDSQPVSRGHDRAETRDGGRTGPRGDGHAGSGENGRARPQDNSHTQPPQRGYLRPEAVAGTPVTTLVTRARVTARAVIGDQLRLPIMWCEMRSCISWFAHPAALGEADIRARAIDAGWRVDAVGLLVCPQCVQTAPGFQSHLPVVLWDREEAMAMSAQMAGEPSAEAVASAAQELSHDLRCPADNHGDEVAPASAWMTVVPADDVARSATRGTSDEVSHPADDHQPGSHPRSGRHRKRLAARLMFASH
jgi:hypothetical protein